MEKSAEETLESILTEGEILKLTGLTKSQLGEMRNKEGHPGRDQTQKRDFLQAGYQDQGAISH